MLDKLLNDYWEMFGKDFPTFEMMGYSEEELMYIIRQCINTKKPYEPKTKEGVMY